MFSRIGVKCLSTVKPRYLYIFDKKLYWYSLYFICTAFRTGKIRPPFYSLSSILSLPPCDYRVGVCGSFFLSLNFINYLFVLPLVGFWICVWIYKSASSCRSLRLSKLRPSPTHTQKRALVHTRICLHINTRSRGSTHAHTQIINIIRYHGNVVTNENGLNKRTAC
jgi:hypothetical protein